MFLFVVHVPSTETTVPGTSTTRAHHLVCMQSYVPTGSLLPAYDTTGSGVSQAHHAPPDAWGALLTPKKCTKTGYNSGYIGIMPLFLAVSVILYPWSWYSFFQGKYQDHDHGYRITMPTNDEITSNSNNVFILNKNCHKTPIALYWILRSFGVSLESRVVRIQYLWSIAYLWYIFYSSIVKRTDTIPTLCRHKIRCRSDCPLFVSGSVVSWSLLASQLLTSRGLVKRFVSLISYVPGSISESTKKAFVGAVVTLVVLTTDIGLLASGEWS